MRQRFSGKSRKKTTERIGRRLSFVQEENGGIHKDRCDRRNADLRLAGRRPPPSPLKQVPKMHKGR